MSTPLASPDVRAAIGDLLVAAEQLQLMTTRAAVAGHPLHPALARLATSSVRCAAQALLGVAHFVAAETARHVKEARP